ncbi:MAG: TonB-dependent receptor domain-containing protein, partial [Pyrinomonadaceae bacterium]
MRSILKRLTFSVFVCASFIFTFSAADFAQDLDKVTISGKITDSNNAPIAGASVTATQTATGTERTVVANEDGFYKIVQLEPGSYTVKFSANGFGAKQQKEFSSVAAQNFQFNISLSPADVKAEQTIVIDDDSALAVDTTRTIVGGTVTEREIDELPNVSRNPLDLVLTLGGTSEEALSTKDLAEDRNSNYRSTPTEQGNFSLSGGASYSNNITIDGLDNNDDRSARDRFQPPLDSVAEVQVITNQFSAEYGRASGGRINLRTRSGTKKFRGRAFMYFRDDNLNANTYYNNSRGIARLSLTDYNPGFTLSGPVILPFGEGKNLLYNGRNRTFFSIAYEYDNLRDTTLIDTYVPLGANPRFALPVSTGGAQACDNSNPNNCTVNPPTAAFVAPYTFTIPTPNRSNVLTARVDHKLSANNDLTIGFQFGRRNNQRTSGSATTRIEDALQIKNANTEAYNFTDNHVFSAKIVNQFRAQYSRFEPSFQTDNPFDPVVLITYRNPVSNGTQTLIAGNSTTSSLQNFADSRREARIQFQDSLTFILGSHTLKAGVDYQRVDSKARALEDSTGTFNFGSVLNFQNNVLSRYRQNFGTATDVKNTYSGVFLNDEVRLRPKLTLSYGLRYERETAVSDHNNFGPRIGVAYSPWKNGKGVIRFGAGIFYNRTLLRTVADFIQDTSCDLFSFDTNSIGTSAADARRAAILAKIAQQFPNSFA